MREDDFTNTPEDAAAYEALRGRAEWIDDRPTRAELEADDYDDWRWHREQQRVAQRPDPWLPWTCQRCGIETPGGQPEVCECGYRNYGEAS
jgi:hypothetical protein